MSVYVDNGEYPYGRMLMCHLLADSQQELLDMAAKIGVSIDHIQYPDSYKEHFDICKSKRKLALQFGAQPIDLRGMARLFTRKRSVQFGRGFPSL